MRRMILAATVLGIGSLGAAEMRTETISSEALGADRILSTLEEVPDSDPSVEEEVGLGRKVEDGGDLDEDIQGSRLEMVVDPERDSHAEPDIVSGFDAGPDAVIYGEIDLFQRQQPEAVDDVVQVSMQGILMPEGPGGGPDESRMIACPGLEVDPCRLAQDHTQPESLP